MSDQKSDFSASFYGPVYSDHDEDIELPVLEDGKPVE
jgi:hypothetical protein